MLRERIGMENIAYLDMYLNSLLVSYHIKSFQNKRLKQARKNKEAELKRYTSRYPIYDHNTSALDYCCLLEFLLISANLKQIEHQASLVFGCDSNNKASRHEL